MRLPYCLLTAIAIAGLTTTVLGQSSLQEIVVSPADDPGGWYNGPIATPTILVVDGRGGGLNTLQAPGTSASVGHKNQYYLGGTQLRSEGGVPTLGDIRSIEYDTKKLGDANSPDWYVQIYTMPYAGSPGSTWYGNRIQSEPYLALNKSAPAGDWNTWSTDPGVNELQWGDSSSGDFGAKQGAWSTLQTTELLGSSTETYAEQEILYFTIGTASGWGQAFTGEIAPIKVNWTNGCQTIIHFGGFSNAAPVADAGIDQSISVAGEVITLDGSQSYDDNLPTSYLLFDWTCISKPTGSEAVLNDSTSENPSFIADLRGDYVFSLVVSEDCPDGKTSEISFTTASTNNLEPTAVAAATTSLLIVGETVQLDGSGSSDPDGDTLVYNWTLVGAPQGSNASLSGVSEESPTLVTDVEGSYTFELTVSDQIGPSESSQVEVVATVATEFAEILILEACSVVESLTEAELPKKGHNNALCKQLKHAVTDIQLGGITEAIEHLNNATRRFDGFPVRGTFDLKGKSRDWVIDEGSQTYLYDLTTAAINALQ